MRKILLDRWRLLGFIALATSLLSASQLSAQFSPWLGACIHNNDSLRFGFSGKKSVCSGTIELTVLGNPSSTVFWTDGYTGNKRTFAYSNTVQAYTVDSSGCYDTTETIELDISQYRAYVNYNTDKACFGQKVFMSAYAWNTPKWSNGDTGFSISVSKSGTYSFTTVHPNGCKDTSNAVKITVLDDPEFKIKFVTDSIRCFGDTIMFEASWKGKGEVFWTTGDTGKRAKVNFSSYVRATWYDWSVGCSVQSDFLIAEIKSPVVESFCMATIDSTGKGVNLIWKKDQPVKGWYVLREGEEQGVFDTLGYVSANAKTEWMDTAVNPRQRSFSYALLAVDSCDNAEPGSIFAAHSTLHLTASLGVSGENNLFWSAYVGLPVKSYEIFRSNQGGAYTSIGTISASKTQYSDLNPPSGVNRYYVAIISDNVSCNPGKTVRLRSNSVIYGSGLSTVDDVVEKASVYPNPGNEYFVVKLESGSVIESVQVFDNAGKLVYKGNVNDTYGKIASNNWVTGFYSIVVKSTTGATTQQKWLKI